MSGHQPPIGHGAVADAVPRRSRSRRGAFAGYRLGDRGRPAQASSRTGGQQPAATAASRETGTRSSRNPDPEPEPRVALPAAAARLHPARARWQQSDATKPQ
jgi:hypothetical protein